MTFSQFWMEVVLYYAWVFILGMFFFYALSFVVFIFFGESLLFKFSKWRAKCRALEKELEAQKRQKQAEEIGRKIKEQRCKSLENH